MGNTPAVFISIEYNINYKLKGKSKNTLKKTITAKYKISISDGILHTDLC